MVVHIENPPGKCRQDNSQLKTGGKFASVIDVRAQNCSNTAGIRLILAITHLKHPVMEKAPGKENKAREEHI